ncbi:MAG: PQQ-dependent sugar dehydrogenase [Candidatus Hydrogenedentes bacterium]|nr:PQQ-dependent sugar dehydrogenase [Candidatus Hydrogenedentota bacterium]
MPIRCLAAVALVFSISAGLMSCPGLPTARLALEPVAMGFKFPTYVGGPPEDASRLVVLEKDTALIWMIRDGSVLEEPFLDLGSVVGSAGLEQGLLGFAFHPDYGQNGFFFVDYTDKNGDTVVARYTVSANPDRADPTSGKTILTIDQPTEIHNGGMIAFGPDGYLYIALGDGGGANDPDNRAQDLGSLLGKILRIDVDSGDPYAIPPDNPFAAKGEVRTEIWAYGLRNPWRFSFDRLTGDLWIGDVGERTREEINFEPADSPGGVNYGWKVREGSVCRPGQDDCTLPGATGPIYDYDKLITQSITGGYVYRGPAAPSLNGAYFFADWATGELRSLRYDGSAVSDVETYSAGAGSISTFGEDAVGNLYLADFGKGTIYRISEEPM